MKRLRLALLAAVASLALPAPAFAQHQGHNMPGTTMPAKKKPAAKKPAAKKKTATKPGAKKPVKKAAPAAGPKGAAKPSDPHAGHTMPAAPAPTTTDPHAGHTMPSAPAQPTADPHAGHEMRGMPAEAATSGTDLPAGNAPAPPVPTDHAADRVYGEGPMQMGRHHLIEFHGGQKMLQVLFNIAEYQARDGRDGFEWGAEGWYGGDINRLWVKTKGEGAFGEPLESAEVQALYSRAIDPYWNVQGGLRYDFKPNPSRFYATVGVEGLAPSFFDVEGALFLSNKGELMARAEGYYDQRITQRLILQPRAELNLAAQNSRDIGVGAGLSDAEIGVRLRYDIRREFAPYVGLQYSRAFGRTRRYLRDEGEEADGWNLVTGVRFWF